MSPFVCEECGNEKAYDDCVVLKCEFGYEHPVCKKCMEMIVRKGKKLLGGSHPKDARQEAKTK